MSSVFSSTIHHAYTCRKCRIFLMLSVTSRQSFAVSFPSHPPLADCYLAMFFSFSVVGRWLDSFFFEIVDGFLACGRVFHQLLAGQLANELHVVRCFVGVFRPPVLSLCVCLGVVIHDNLVKMWRTSFLHDPATPHLWC